MNKHKMDTAVSAAINVAARLAHESDTGCTHRLPCRDCDEEMRRLWYGGEDE